MKDSILYFLISFIQEEKNYKGQNQTFLKIFFKKNDLFVSIILTLNMQGE